MYKNHFSISEFIYFKKFNYYSICETDKKSKLFLEVLKA